MSSSAVLTARIAAILQLYWDVGVTKVSPGALGMQLQGRPVEAHEARHIAETFAFTTWEPDLVDGWIVIVRDPRGG